MNQQQKLFSIVLANYNHAGYLEQAIQSILNQSFVNFEFIIIDGGSTDGSVDIIKKYQDRITYWISEKDAGQSDAFNKGFKVATGKFGFWVNADDLLLPDALLMMKKAIDKNPEGNWFIANTMFMDKDNKIVKCRKGTGWIDCLFQNSPVEVYGPSSVYSLDLLREVGGFDLSMYYSMDTDLWIRFAKVGAKFIYVNHYMWGFRLHEGSKSSDSYTQKDETIPKWVIENNRILEKNNWSYSKLKVYLKKMIKLINGAYIKSFIDSKNLRGKRIIY